MEAELYILLSVPIFGVISIIVFPSDYKTISMVLLAFMSFALMFGFGGPRCWITGMACYRKRDMLFRDMKSDDELKPLIGDVRLLIDEYLWDRFTRHNFSGTEELPDFLLNIQKNGLGKEKLCFSIKR